MVMSPQVSWLFFKTRAKRPYLSHTGRASNAEKQPTGRRPEGCVANSLPKPAGIQRLRIGANVVLQTIIVAAIVLMINYVGFNRYQRWDLSRFNKYALSELTKKLL